MRLLKSKLFWFIAGFSMIGLIALGITWSVMLSEVKSKLAAVREQGLPTAAREINDFYVVPDGVADTTDLWVTAILDVQSADLSNRAATLPIVGNGPMPVPPPGQRWDELEAARLLLLELGPELRSIQRAAAAGGQVRFPIDFSAGINLVLPQTQASREVSRLLQLDAYVAAHDGDGARTLQDLQAIFALSDALRGEPILISQLVRVAIHTVACHVAIDLLPHCDWSDADLAALQADIQAARFREDLTRAMHGERALCLTALKSIPLGPLRQPNERAMLRFFDESIDGFSKPWPDALDRQRELADRLSSQAASTASRISLSGVLLLVPAYEQAGLAGARADARQKCACAMIALQRSRLMDRSWPDSLDELDPELLGPAFTSTAQLIDPFDGKPLRFRSDESRITIYSIGDNGEDDGGDCEWRNQSQPSDVGYFLSK